MLIVPIGKELIQEVCRQDERRVVLEVGGFFDDGDDAKTKDEESTHAHALETPHLVSLVLEVEELAVLLDHRTAVK